MKAIILCLIILAAMVVLFYIIAIGIALYKHFHNMREIKKLAKWADEYSKSKK